MTINVLRTQEYSTNLELLSQQMKPMLGLHCMIEQASGSKAFRMKSQIDKTSAVETTTRAKPAMDVEVDHDGRWVYGRNFDWGKVVDDIDLSQTSISPQGPYTRSALAALNRAKDDLFLAAFFGDAQTGETGATTTSFDSNNQIAHNFGATTGVSVEKMREAQKILLDNDVDLDMEEIYMAVSPQGHDDLLALTQVVSTDFNDRPVLVDGRVRKFLNMNIIISTRLPTDGSGYRRCPVFVKSAMGCGIWKDINGVVRKRPDLQREPDYVEASMMLGYTRLEEAKAVEIKAQEA